jgi:hypothetical protein
MTDLAKILKTEFSERFVELMKNAMVVSFYKYGLLRDAYPHPSLLAYMLLMG